MRHVLSYWLLPTCALTLAVTKQQKGLAFHNLEARQQNLPTLKLPYGTWQASDYDGANDVSWEFFFLFLQNDH